MKPLRVAVIIQCDLLSPLAVEAKDHLRFLLPSSPQIHESSPLDLASEEPERLPCLQRLLELGANVNAADKNGPCLFPSHIRG